MIPSLSDEQRRSLTEIGTPVPIYDSAENSGFILLPAEITPDPSGGYLAGIPGLPAIGAGDTPEDAIVALSVVLGTTLTGSESVT